MNEDNKSLFILAGIITIFLICLVAYVMGQAHGIKMGIDIAMTTVSDICPGAVK